MVVTISALPTWGAFYLYNAAVSQEDIIRNYDATKARYT